nr:S1/P1 nuclease [Gammaproteobacteria bacterium]
FTILRQLSGFILCLLPLMVWSWSGSGHRVIAAIAYQALQPNVKVLVNRLTAKLYHYHNPERRFLKASVLPDALKAQGIKTYNRWHYINYPDAVDDVRLPRSAKLNRHNVAWAVRHCLRELQRQDLVAKERARYLAFLIHFVGDAHQPMHCIIHYSHNFPYGDYGGNRFPIMTARAKNLHQYWDRGVGLFYFKGHRYPLSYAVVLNLAAKLVKQYPADYFGSRIKNTNPYVWTRAGYRLAKKYAYNIAVNGIPSASYIKTGQRITKLQLTLAGYRLAFILNKNLLNMQHKKL